MALLAIQLNVRDFHAWRELHDSMSESREQWGMIAESFHRLEDAPNIVLVLRRFATVAQAQGFLTNRELQNSIRQIGVEGTLGWRSINHRCRPTWKSRGTQPIREDAKYEKSVCDDTQDTHGTGRSS